MENTNKTYEGYFDGNNIRLDNPSDLKANQRVIVTVLNTATSEESKHNQLLKKIGFAKGLIESPIDIDMDNDEILELFGCNT